MPGFAKTKTDALLNFDYSEADKLAEILNIKSVEEINNDLPLDGRKYVITGTLKEFKNRAELQKFIEDKGGKVVSGVSKNTTWLVTNTPNSGTSKNVTAQRLGIPIITEEEFINLYLS